MGEVRKLENGKYQSDVRDKNGKRKRVIFIKKEEAVAYVAKVEEEKYKQKLSKNGLEKIPARFETVISEAIQSKRSLATKSFVKYRRVYEVLENFVNKSKISFVDDFSRLDADSFKNDLVSSGVTAKTINFYLTTIKSLFKELVLKQLIEVNPFDHVKLEREKRKNLLDREDDYYNEKEIKAFFAESMLPEYRIAFIGLFLTGMRFAEFSSLIWQRVNLEKRIIQIRSDENFTTKTISSERDIPISNKLLTILTQLNKNRNTELVFTSPRNTKFREPAMLMYCKEVAKSAKIKKNATLHKWRHSFNSHLAQSGVDYTVRQYLLGHKPQTITDHYTKIDPTKLYDQVSKLDHLINNEPTK